MNHNCPICCVDPSSHSLMLYKEINNIMYFYTCPSQSKLYFDTKGIIIHYDGILSQIPEDKKWVWVIDSKDYSFKHFIEIPSELLPIIDEHSENAKEVIRLADLENVDNWPYWKKARDMNHPGSRWTKFISEMFFNEMVNKYGTIL